jgi:hypothetical protein
MRYRLHNNPQNEDTNISDNLDNFCVSPNAGHKVTEDTNILYNV